MWYNTIVMFRGFLCFWFALTSIGGSTICCCLAKPFIAKTAVEIVQSNPLGAEDPFAACPHCKKEKKKAEQPKLPLPKPVPQKQCPCCPEMAAIDLSVPPVSQTTLLSDELSQVFHVPFAWLPQTEKFASESAILCEWPPPDKPFNRDLLSILQILRC